MSIRGHLIVVKELLVVSLLDSNMKVALYGLVKGFGA